MYSLTPTEKVAFLTQALSWTMSLMETPTLEMIRVSSAIPPGLQVQEKFGLTKLEMLFIVFRKEYFCSDSNSLL